MNSVDDVFLLFWLLSVVAYTASMGYTKSDKLRGSDLRKEWLPLSSLKVAVSGWSSSERHECVQVQNSAQLLR